MDDKTMTLKAVGIFLWLLFLLAVVLIFVDVLLGDPPFNSQPVHPPTRIHEQRIPPEERLDLLEKRIAELEKTVARR